MELVFGGTFDPPTRAHVLLPQAARIAVGAQTVRYVPAAISPHKLDAPPTPASDRLHMLRLALEGVDHTCIDERELRRSGPSYTIDTLLELQAEDPRPRRLLIGSDQAMAFDRWHRWADIIELAPPLVMLRANDLADTLLQTLGSHWEARLLDLERLEDSSTSARAGNLDVVPESLHEWITSKGLYEVRA
ncbi:MAG: nicotinate-nicotinamide nucleotide adenylyltransferase [Phycisphaerales bacterium]|nr:nicotinate-nicotinamide nucleotide adenylyltransferase [Phycisphaerales bacterium]